MLERSIDYDGIEREFLGYAEEFAGYAGIERIPVVCQGGPWVMPGLKEIPYVKLGGSTGYAGIER